MSTDCVYSVGKLARPGPSLPLFDLRGFVIVVNNSPVPYPLEKVLVELLDTKVATRDRSYSHPRDRQAVTQVFFDRSVDVFGEYCLDYGILDNRSRLSVPEPFPSPSRRCVP
jgi:hypothetical protein